MMRKIFTLQLVFFVMFAVAIVFGAAVSGKGTEEKSKEKKNTPSLQEQLGNVVQHYLEIQKLLSSDSTSELAKKSAMLSRAANESIKIAGKDKDPKKNKDLVRVLKIAVKSADGLAVKKIGLAEARDTFKNLSASVIIIAQEYLPEKERNKYRIFHCSMADAKWIQEGKKVSNPYYGKEMLTCGKEVSSKDAGKGERHEHHEGHEGHEGHKM